MNTNRVSIFANVRNDRGYRASTGLSVDEFNRLLLIFSKYYQPKTYQLSETYTMGPAIQDPGEALFFILFFKKTYPTYDVLGINFGLSNKTAHQYVQQLKVILKKALAEEKVLPFRVFESGEEQVSFFSSIEECIIDATERPTQRPSNEVVQKERYSGKKKLHTVKNTIITDVSQWIYYVGATVSGGKIHDFKLLKNEFPPQNNCFAQSQVWIDSGYQGFQKLYTTQATHLPIKRPRKSKKNPMPSLTEEQKLHNRKVSKTIIFVENAIGRIKKFNVLNYKLRSRIESFADELIEVCAGLANFKIKCKVQNS